MSPGAASGCTFWRHCILGLQLAALAVLAGGCAGGWPAPAPRGLAVYSAPPPSAAERYCAWYGSAADSVLYFGQAPFWSAMRAAGGDPRADLAHPGPQLVGRFDLARERLLPALEVGRGGERSGVWDVQALPDGRVFFTTFYEAAGAVDPGCGGAVEHFDHLGGGLNELALVTWPQWPWTGDYAHVLVTRYGSGSDDGGDGELLVLEPDGSLHDRAALPPPPGYRSAPKTPARDDEGAAYWVTSDLLPLGEGPVRHDAFVLDAALGSDGEEALVRLQAEPELHFVARGPDGATHFAEVSGSTLSLRTRPPRGSPGRGRRVLLDEAFDAGHDFAQDVQPAADGRVVVTRWSGLVHVVHPDGRVGTVRLPRLDAEGLYYTGVVHGERLCVTYCADVSVVCTDAP